MIEILLRKDEGRSGQKKQTDAYAALEPCASVCLYMYAASGGSY